MNHDSTRRTAQRLAAATLAAAFTSIASAATPGSPAPDIAATDALGKAVKLSDFRGKYVVLEWTNPDCPFVQKHYDSKNMQGLQREWGAKDVVWLSVNSTREGHSEYRSGAQMDTWMKAQDGTPQAVLIDGRSTAGRAYAAKTTPHMFVIDPAGNVVYAGAIDDKRSSNPADVKTAKNYVRAALAEATTGKPVSVASTTPYGCSVKY
ncbi:glutathione peroxidase [Burkholderiales bacterium]|nr:glutathione peroxidase [Burkholderiales bacterium]